MTIKVSGSSSHYEFKFCSVYMLQERLTKNSLMVAASDYQSVKFTLPLTPPADNAVFILEMLGETP